MPLDLADPEDPLRRVVDEQSGACIVGIEAKTRHRVAGQADWCPAPQVPRQSVAMRPGHGGVWGGYLPTRLGYSLAKPGAIGAEPLGSVLSHHG